MTCTFPFCASPVVGHNRAYQPTCSAHRAVVVAMTDDLGHGKGCEGVSDQ